MKDKFTYLKMRILNNLLNAKNNNSGMGVIEIVLIILVLVGLALIFRTQITSILGSIFSKITKNVNKF